MSYYLSKVLPLLVMPVSLALIGAILALLFLWRRKPRIAATCLSLSIVVLWVSSAPAFAGRMLFSLERQFPPVSLEETPVSDCIILLGGAVGDKVYPRTDIELSGAIDRVYQAARLYRNGKGNAVIVAAGNQPWLEDLTPEALLIERLLVEWGVPQSAILLDQVSRNTYENANNAHSLLAEAGCESSLMVTSGWHMPRAKAVFDTAGIDVQPFSVDVLHGNGTPGWLVSIIPTGDALAATSMVIREWMGVQVYRWRGWID